MATKYATQTSTTIPYQSDYLDKLYSRADQLYGRGGINPYTGQTVAGMSPERDQALRMTADRAMAGTPFLDTMNQQLEATMRGDYLSPESNPFLRSVYEQAARGVGETFRDYTQPQTDAQAVMAGRYGSGMLNDQRSRNEQNFGRTLNELATGIYAPAYEAERSRQLDAMRYAPAAAELNYLDPQMLAMVGQDREAQQQRELAAAEKLYYDRQMQPFDNLSRYQSYISGGAGGTSTQTSPYYTNNLARNIGLGLGGLGLLGSISNMGRSGQNLYGLGRDFIEGLGNFIGFG